MIDVGRDLAELKEKFKILSGSVIELLNHFVKTVEHTTGLTQKRSEIRQQISLFYDRIAEMKDNAIKLEKKLKKPVPQATSLADVMRMPNPTSNVLQTPSSAERIDRLEYTASEEDRRSKLFQVKITQFLSQSLNIRTR